MCKYCSESNSLDSFCKRTCSLNPNTTAKAYEIPFSFRIPNIATCYNSKLSSGCNSSKYLSKK